MWEIDGLPLHPLIVHAPVVLIPLVAAGLALHLLVPGSRRLLGPLLAAMAIGAGVTAVAAASSGDALGDSLRRGVELGEHRTFGERTRLLAVLLAVGAAALAVYGRRVTGSSGAADEVGRAADARARMTVATAAVLAVAVAAVVSVAQTGHSGAELAWAGTLPTAAPATGTGTPGAAGSTAATTPPAPTTAAPPPAPVEPGVDVALGEWALIASTAEAPPGPTTFRIRNAGTVTHALRIRTPGSGRDRLEWRSVELGPGGAASLVADLGPGAYELTCPIEDGVGEHDALGMEAPFTSNPAAPPPTVAPPPPPPPIAPSAGGGSGPATGAVDIAGFAFAPASLTVPVGTEVVFTNRDPAPHTATGDGFDTGSLAQGAVGAVRFDRSGRFDYFCAIHPAMTGTVLVE